MWTAAGLGLALGALQLGTIQACTGSGKSDGGAIVGYHDAGPKPVMGNYTITQLSTTPTGESAPLYGSYNSLQAVASSDGRIGIVFISNSTDITHPYEIDYTEISAAGTQGPVVTVDQVSNIFGASVAFSPQGVPWVAYLALDPNGAAYTPGQFGYPDGGQVVAWHEHCLGIASIVNNAVGTRDYPAHLSSDADAGDSFSNSGDVVGLNPAIAFDPSNGDTVVAYRDVHYGQFPLDYAKSDLKAARGHPGSWLGEVIIDGTTNGMWTEPGIGALTSMAVTPSLGLGVITSGEPDVMTTPDGVYFAMEAPGGGGWKHQALLVPIAADPGPTGATLAGDSQAGFGLAWVDMNTNILSYESSVDGITWGGAEAVFGSGTGGWYPTLAFDANHIPNVAFFDCAAESGVSGSSCPADQQALLLATQAGTGAQATWPETIIDPAGGYNPQLVLVNGKLDVVYRDLVMGGLKLAVPASSP